MSRKSKRTSKSRAAAGSIPEPKVPAEMTNVPNAARVSFPKSDWLPMWIVLAGLMAYANSFQGEFILDDQGSIENNRSIRQLWPLGRVLFPERDLIPDGSTVEGRPLLNLSLALNYAAHRLAIWGYHAVNLTIHILNGLLLFGIVRRTLLLPQYREHIGSASARLALLIALLWVLHPVQTESVTYKIQRAESLVGMFYLLTMYLSIRSLASSSPRGWRVGAVAACVLGMAAKEVMVTAPLLVLLYDWVFVSGSWRELWRTRSRYYALLMILGWSALAAVLLRTSGSNLANVKALLLQLGDRETGVWEGHEVYWTDYARMQLWAVARYVRLSFWPHPLVFTYGSDIANGSWGVVPSALVVLLLLTSTLWALWRRNWMGYAGAWFFLILAPTSSVVPLSGQFVAEHRMYLPLAAPVVLTVVGCFLLWRRMVLQPPAWRYSKVVPWRIIFTALTVAVVILLTGLTLARNLDYRTNISIWKDTIGKWPGNVAAFNNLGKSLLKTGNIHEAMNHFHEAVARWPEYADAHNSLGIALLQLGQVDESIDEHRKALEIAPEFTSAHINLGNALMQKGRLDEAVLQFQKAIALHPRAANAHSNLGSVLQQQGKLDDAIQHHRKALEIDPDFAEAHNNLGNALAQKGESDEAVEHFKTALTLKPDFVEACYDLGTVYFEQGKLDAAIHQLRKTLEIAPDHPDAHNNLGTALLQKGKVSEAASQFDAAIKLNPSKLEALNNLAWIRATSTEALLRDGARAMELAQQALKISGDHPTVLQTLAAAHAESGRFAEADEIATRALSLASAQGNEALAGLIRDARKLYQDGKPLRVNQTPASPPAKQP